MYIGSNGWILKLNFTKICKTWKQIFKKLKLVAHDIIKRCKLTMIKQILKTQTYQEWHNFKIFNLLQMLHKTKSLNSNNTTLFQLMHMTNHTHSFIK